MTFRPLFLTGLFAASLALAACGGGSEAPPAEVSLDDIGERSLVERAAYLEAYRLGEQIAQQDSSFNLDEFLRGLRTGFETDSAVAFPYVVGYQRGLEMQIQTRRDSSFAPNLGIYAAALREGVTGDSIRLDQREEQTINEEMQMQQIRREAGTNPQAQAFLTRLEEAGVRADSFLTANAQGDGVQTTESGLQYTVNSEGEGGESPEMGDRVLVTYTGRFIDGTVFDQSPEGQPVDFVVGEVVPGMEEALMDMTVGESRTIVLPPRLGYGVFGDNRRIGPNTVLIFDLELIDILDPVADPGAQLPTPIPVPQPTQ
ncbi:MAG: FKBP-type peptidyl-prolyl cis-trans isomerase [Rhodothermaceae bacterium]|nr:FKBP-type peptidyl-prolyl cis-trans isomerase [Rhodothermaceae bacterium]